MAAKTKKVATKEVAAVEETVDPWTTSKADARTIVAVIGGKRLRIFTNDNYSKRMLHFVYCNGEFLGCEEKMRDAKKLAASGRRKDGVDIHDHNVMDIDLTNDQLGIPPGLRLTQEEREEAWRERHATSAARAALTHARPIIGAPPAPAPAPRRASAPLSGTIHRLRDGNPKKAGSAAHGRWEKLLSSSGKSVQEYAKSGGNLTTLANAVARGWVEVR